MGHLLVLGRAVVASLARTRSLLTRPFKCRTSLSSLFRGLVLPCCVKMISNTKWSGDYLLFLLGRKIAQHSVGMISFSNRLRNFMYLFFFFFFFFRNRVESLVESELTNCLNWLTSQFWRTIISSNPKH